MPRRASWLSSLSTRLSMVAISSAAGVCPTPMALRFSRTAMMRSCLVISAVLASSSLVALDLRTAGVSFVSGFLHLGEMLGSALLGLGVHIGLIGLGAGRAGFLGS